MPRLALIAALTMLLTPATADARLFWQTYGATVGVEDGCGGGCHWNLNQDYFVPRHCHSCQYGLFSACKVDHSRSAACRNLHPIYSGYCTPYGSCRYKWRDHVYKTYCGCTPLRCVYGPWHLKKCDKHALVKRHAQPGCICESAACRRSAVAGSLASSHDAETYNAAPYAIATQPHGAYCPPLEPFGGETLGSIAALPAGMAGSAPAAATSGTVVNPLPPKLELVPSQPAPSPLPAPFDF
jgi:hypothetical protein